MAVWNKKALFATAFISCAPPVLLHKHFKCNLASVVDELVRLQFLFLWSFWRVNIMKYVLYREPD